MKQFFKDVAKDLFNKRRGQQARLMLIIAMLVYVIVAFSGGIKL